MKLHIAIDQTDLTLALNQAERLAPYTDTLHVYSPLILKYGMTAVKKFSSLLPEKTIVADTKIIDHAKQIVSLCHDSGATWLTVMAGAPQQVIRLACTNAHTTHKKIMMNLTDSSSLGQSALEASSLGIDALIFMPAYTESTKLEFLDSWEIITGNTKLPILIACPSNEAYVREIAKLNPYGIIITLNAGLSSIEEKAEIYYKICS